MQAKSLNIISRRLDIKIMAIRIIKINANIFTYLQIIITNKKSDINISITKIIYKNIVITINNVNLAKNSIVEVKKK